MVDRSIDSLASVNARQIDSDVPPAGGSATMPSVSIVVTVHNRTRYLAESLDSLLQQEYPGSVEVIVVDDGSDVPIGSNVRSEYPTVQFVRQAHRGLGAARQTGSLLASGEFVGFQDDDDRWCAGKLSKQVECLLAHPGLAAVASDVGHFVGDQPLDGRLYHATPLYQAAQAVRDASSGCWIYPQSALVEPILLAYPFFAQSLLIRRDALRQIGGWNESIRLYSECFDLFYRLTRSGDVGFLDEVTVEIRRGHSHMTKDGMRAERGESASLAKWAVSLTASDRRVVCPLLLRRFVRTGLRRLRRGDMRNAGAVALAAVQVLRCAPVACVQHMSERYSQRSRSRTGTPTSSLGDPGPSAWSPG